MFLNRRQFLLAVPGFAAGFILPSFLKRATEFLEDTDSPLIVPPEQYDTVISAEWDDTYGYQLNIGDSMGQPPPLTLRGYLQRYYPGDPNDYRLRFGLAESEFQCALDREVEWDIYVDKWLRHDSSQALAYNYLGGLDLGPDLDSEHAVGSIRFIDGANPGSNYYAAHAPDALSLSLLQERLNQLGQGVLIEAC